MPTSRKYLRLATRYTLLFGVLAVMIVGLAWLAWRATAEANRNDAARARADEIVGMISEFETATQPLASRAMCAITGGPALSPEDLAASTWPGILARLTGAIGERPEMLEAVSSLQREATLLDQTLVDPLRKACSQLQRLGAAEVQSRMRVTAPQRARVQEGIKRLRNLALEQRMTTARTVEESSKAARQWLGMLSMASILLALSSPIVARSFSLRLSDMERQLRDESQEREMAREQLSAEQRRMHLMLDHVRDAVVTFDALGRIDWVNPAAEALFGVERRVLHGCPVTQILPGIDDRTRLVNSPEIAATAVVEDNGLAWTTRLLYLEGMRVLPEGAGDERLSLEVSLLQTRVDGHDVGVCVARPVASDGGVIVTTSATIISTGTQAHLDPGSGI